MTALLMNLLAADHPEFTDKGFPIQWLGMGEGALYALLGFAVTFLGIVILIFFVWLCGKILKSGGKFLADKKEKKTAKQSVVVPAQEETQPVASDEIPIEVRLAIIAAVTAYYSGEQSPCEFKVKRIKRL